jgi:hypothetical protein
MALFRIAAPATYGTLYVVHNILSFALTNPSTLDPPYVMLFDIYSRDT